MLGELQTLYKEKSEWTDKLKLAFNSNSVEGGDLVEAQDDYFDQN